MSSCIPHEPCSACKRKDARIAKLLEELAVYRQDGAEAISAVLAEVPHALLAQKNKRIDELEGLLAEAADDIADWGAYASEYFQQKHDLEGCVARYRAALREGE